MAKHNSILKNAPGTLTGVVAKPGKGRSAMVKRKGPAINPGAISKRSQKKYSLPVIGHFSDRSIEFNSILQASEITKIHYTLIFEACIGKIYKAKNVIFEFKKGNHYIKYKAYYINVQENYNRRSGFNG